MRKSVDINKNQYKKIEIYQMKTEQDLLQEYQMILTEVHYQLDRIKDPKEKLRYLEYCIEKKYIDEVKKCFSDQYRLPSTLNELTSNNRLTFEFCRNRYSRSSRSGNPWAKAFIEIYNLHYEIQEFHIPKDESLIEGNNPVKLFEIFKAEGIAKLNNTGQLNSYKYLFIGSVSMAYTIWYTWQDKHRQKRLDFFSMYMRIDKKNKAVPLYGTSLKSHSKTTELPRSLHNKLDNYF